VVDHADLLDLGNRSSILKIDHVRAYRKVLSIFDLHTIRRDVHPRPTLRLEIYDVKTFKSIVLELCVFGRQSNSLDLQGETIEFDIS